MKKFIYTLFIVMLLAGVIASTVMASFSVNPKILAGQNTLVGFTRIAGGTDFLRLKFALPYGWCMTETNVHVALDPMDIPQNNGGAIPGQFDYKTDHDGCVTRFTLDIPTDPAWFGKHLYLGIHVVVIGPDGQEETGWTVNCGDLGAGQFPGANWSAYAQYPANAWYAGPVPTLP